MNPIDSMAVGAARAAVFIDADNVEAEVIEQAFAVMRDRGLRVSIRRAYGGLDRLVVLRDACAGHGVTMFPNHGKGTTDASLIVDAMDLLHADGLPAVVAIASADSDFAPLAVRMREAGCHTICLANPDKADADALGRSYDEVIFVGRRRVRATPAKAATKRAAPAAAPVPAAPADPSAARLKALLSSVGLGEGKSVELNAVVEMLRREKLLGRTGSGPRFLAKNAPYLRLSPEQQPNKVHWPGRNH